MTTTVIHAPEGNVHSTKVRVRWAVSVFYFFQGLCFASWASRIPDIKAALMLSDGAMGSILFALPAGQMCTMPISGYLVGKYGSKKIMHFSLPLYSLAMIILALAHAPWQLALALFLFGVTGNGLGLCEVAENRRRKFRFRRNVAKANFYLLIYKKS